MTRSVRTALAALMLLAGALTACEPASPPITVATIDVGSGHGFGGGTIYYPEGATGTHGAVVAAPGFTESQSAVAVYGPMLAKYGFVVFTIDTNSVFDDPSSRASQLLDAVDYLANSSDVAGLVDPSHVAVMGHSMGGGGALIAAEQRPSLAAAIALAPWNSDTTDFSGDTVPTLFLTCENDGIAPNDSHSLPFYQSIPDAVPKAYLQVAGGNHFCTNSEHTTVDVYLLAWLLHFVNDNTSINPCPPPAVSSEISKSMSSCPF